MKQKRKKHKQKDKRKKKKNNDEIEEKQVVQKVVTDEKKKKKKSKQKRKDKSSSKPKSSKKKLIPLQNDISEKEFQSIVNNISKRYTSQAHFYILDQKYWQKQRQKQELRELKQLNKKIKQQLIQNNQLDEELNLQRQAKTNEINIENSPQSIKTTAQIKDNTNQQNQKQLSKSLQKVKIQCESSAIQRKTRKKVEEEQFLRTLFDDQKDDDQDDIETKDKEIDPETELKKGLKQRTKQKDYLLLVKYQKAKSSSRLIITDMQGTFWQLKLTKQYFENLKKSLNLSSSLKTFIQYFIKSLETKSKLKQLDRIKQQEIQNLIEVDIELAIGEGLLMNCKVQVPRLLSMHEILMTKKDRHKHVEKKEVRKEYDKQLKKFMLNVYECKEAQLQKEKQKWISLANAVTQQMGNQNQDSKLSKEGSRQQQSKSNGQNANPTKNNTSMPPYQPAMHESDKIRQMITNTVMQSLENPFYGGPTQNLEAYNPPGINEANVDKTKQISKKYKTDLMNPNRIRRKKQKGVKLFQ